MTASRMPGPPGPGPLVQRFIRFVALAGCGWLLDLCLLLLLVRVGGAAPSLANVASSMTAAGLVFLVARTRVFDGAKGGVPARLGVYLVYTLLVIATASAVVGALVPRLVAGTLLPGLGALGATAAAAAAKVLVTPPQLLMNFVVSRFLSERPGLLAEESHG